MRRERECVWCGVVWEREEQEKFWGGGRVEVEETLGS